MIFDINWNIVLFFAFLLVIYCSYIRSDYDSDEYSTVSIYIDTSKPSKPASRPKVSKSSTQPKKEVLQAPKAVKKPVTKHPFLEDAVLALRGLGYKKSDAYKIVNAKINEGNFETLENLVMECLK